MVKYYNGIPIEIPNTIVTDNKEENYYISYNNSSRDYGTVTTAIVITIKKERMLFYILKGNHSKQLEACKDLKACIHYYMDNKDLIHNFSDKFEHEYLLKQ